MRTVSGGKVVFIAAASEGSPLDAICVVHPR